MARRLPATLLRARPTTLLGGLALLLGVLLTVPLGLSTPNTLPTAAADDSTEVTIQLTKLTPSIVRPDSTIVIQGRVTNVSKRSLVRLQATIWRSLTPLTTAAELQQANTSAPTDPEGERMYSADTPEAYQDLYTAAHPDLGPGESRTFTVRARADDFFAPDTPQTGVYLAGIQVRENGVQTVGRARTLLPVSVGTLSPDGLLPGQASIGSTTLVELTATPSMARPGVFVEDSLAEAVAPGARLDALLTAAARDGASYAVDPDLIAELEAMRSGYKIVDSDGHTTTGTGASYATSWLTRFRAMQADHDGFQILYADADLPAMVHAGRLDLIERGQRAAAQVADTKDLPLLVTPAGGVADRPTLQAATRLHAKAVLLADTTVDGLGPVVRAPGSPLVLSYDTETAAGGPGPEPRDTEVQVRQASLADSFITSISGRPSSSLGRLRVITQAGEAGGESAALSAPWVSPRSAYALLNNTPAQLQADPQYPAAAAGQEPTRRQLERVVDLEQNLTTYQNLVVNSAGLSGQTDQAVARAASQAWRGQRRPMAAFIQSQQLLLKDTHGRPLPLSALTSGQAIRLDSSPQVTLTGSSATVPVTIINYLDVPVRLQLLGQSPNQSRLRLNNVPASKLGVNGVIGAGAKIPAQVPTRVDANGAMTVTLQLATPSGELIGPEHKLRVNATQAGMIGWIIALASGIVLLGTVVLRIRQVARERGDQAGEDDDPDQDQDEDQNEDQNEDQQEQDQDRGRQEQDHDHDLSTGVSRG